MSNDFDPLVTETFDSPYEEFRDLRAKCPVAHSDAWGGFWALLKHDDVVRATSEWQTFITSQQNVVPKVAFTGRRPPLHLDPPEHTPYRRALAPLLAEKRIAGLEPMVRDISRRLIGAMVVRGAGDVCADFSSNMPVAVFGHWMKLKADAIDDLAAIGRRYNIAVQSNDVDATKVESARLYEIARDIVAARRNAPLPVEQEAASALLAVRVNGEPLPEELIVGTIRQVLVVGLIAPSVVIGAIAVHLARDRVLQDRLRAEPSLVPDAVEEFLRLYTPYRGFARTAVEGVTFRGRDIPAGEPIALVYASANRDEAVFDEPDQFRIDRPNMGDSLAFGRGPHTCVGAALARLELVVAVEELLAAAPGFRLDGEPVQTRFPEIGALSAPIRFEGEASR